MDDGYGMLLQRGISLKSKAKHFSRLALHPLSAKCKSVTDFFQNSKRQGSLTRESQPGDRNSSRMLSETGEGAGEKKKEEVNRLFEEIRRRVRDDREDHLSKAIKLEMSQLSALISPISQHNLSDLIKEEEQRSAKRLQNQPLYELLLRAQQEVNDSIEDCIEFRFEMRELEMELDLMRKENAQLRGVLDDKGQLSEIQQQMEQFSLMVLSKGEIEGGQSLDLLRALFGQRALKKMLSKMSDAHASSPISRKKRRGNVNRHRRQENLRMLVNLQ